MRVNDILLAPLATGWAAVSVAQCARATAQSAVLCPQTLASLQPLRLAIAHPTSSLASLRRSPHPAAPLPPSFSHQQHLLHTLQQPISRQQQFTIKLQNLHRLNIKVLANDMLHPDPRRVLFALFEEGGYFFARDGVELRFLLLEEFEPVDAEF